MKYGIILKDLRTSNLYTQKDMANLLNISRSTYKDYELQIKIIPIKYLNILSNYYHVSIDYLLGLTNNIKDTNKEINIQLQAKRIHDLRKEYKLNQESLAKFLNTSHSMISDYENAKKLISTPYLYDLCVKYNISADYLLGKTDSPKYLNK